MLCVAAESGSHFEIQPILSSTYSGGMGSGGGGQGAGTMSYESFVVIGSMSVSGLMLAFSMAAITYVIRKRKQFRTTMNNPAGASSSMTTKSEYSLRTVAEQLDNDQNHHHSLPRISSRYSLRKDVEYGRIDPTAPFDSDWIDVSVCIEDDDITPYATFTLKPICGGMDTGGRSLASYPPPIQGVLDDGICHFLPPFQFHVGKGPHATMG